MSLVLGDHPLTVWAPDPDPYMSSRTAFDITVSPSDTFVVDVHLVGHGL